MSKQIVPDEVVNSWYGQCDSSELEYYIANRAAEWALEQAAGECAKYAELFQSCARGTEDGIAENCYLLQNAAARHCENAIRAMMQGEGNGL